MESPNEGGTKTMINNRNVYQDGATHFQALDGGYIIQGGDIMNIYLNGHSGNGGTRDREDLLSLLNPIVDASHTRNLKLSPPNSRCFPGTRQAVLKDIRSWAFSPLQHDQPHIMWIFGHTGCGKSAIAQSIANEFAQDRHLLACFFFFRNSGDRSTTRRLGTTIAFQAARSYPDLAPLIEEALLKNPGLLSTTTSSVSAQFRELICVPINTITPLLPESVLIVLDGVDECGDHDEVSELIEDLIENFTQHPGTPLRILITSRVEEHLHQRLHSSKQVKLFNLVGRTSNADIATALNIEIQKRKKSSRVVGCDPSWPSECDKRKLVKHIGGSFIFMTTVIKVLFDSKDGLTPMQRLPLVLSKKPDFDHLYKSILEPFQHLPHFYNIISTIALALRSVSISEIAGLLELRTAEVVNILVNLQAIIQVPGDDRMHVTLWHTSLRDFLTTRDRAGPLFASPTHHVYIARRCIRLAAECNPLTRPAAEYSQRYALDHLNKISSNGEDTSDPYTGTLAGLERCLSKPVFLVPSRKDGCRRPALEVACRASNWRLVSALVEAKVNVNVRFEDRGDHIVTALHAACHHRKFDIVYSLLENGADPNVSGGLSTEETSDFRYGTPLAFASHEGDVKLVSRLLACRADPNLQGGIYSTALQAACDEGRLRVVKLLLRHGADPNLTGGRDGSALHTSYNDISCAKALLKGKADPNVRDQQGGTPLHDVCHWGHAKIAELLLDFGADITIRNDDGETPFHLAVKWRGENSDVVRMLRQKGVTK